MNFKNILLYLDGEWTLSVKSDQSLELTAISAKNAAVPLMTQPIILQAKPASNPWPWILRCVASLFYEYALVRAAEDQMEPPPPPVPRDMTWHADGTHGATHGAWCEAEKNQFECFSLAVVNHTGAGKHHYQENVYCSVMVIEKLQSCFSRLALGTFFFFMKQLRRQGNSKQAGWPQFVSAGWSEWTHSLSVSLLIMLLLHLAESKTFLCTSEDGACKPLR